MPVLTRRDFLQWTGSAAVGSLYAGTLRAATAAPLRSQGPRRRVIVIGAGLAGLSAAYELVAAGHDVTVLEARTRPGGRVYTLREPFSDGLCAEVGATRISNLHDWVLKYVDRFGLVLDPFRPAGRDVYHVRGERIVVGEGAVRVDWPMALTPEEQRLGLAGMWAKYVAPVLNDVGDAGAPGAPPDRLRPLDDMSLRDFIRQSGASPAAAELLFMGSGSNEIDGAALGRLRAHAWRTRTTRWSKIRGGNDLLPKAFAAALSDRTHYGTPVVRIEPSAARVRVTARRGDVSTTFDGDFVVCALPFSVLRQIEVQPGFSTAVERTIRDLPFSTVTKVFVQTRSRFWEAENLSGFGVTDRPIMDVWNLSASQPGKRGLLMAYMTGTHAADAARLNPDRRVDSTAGHMDALFPGTLRELEGGASHAWADDPWSRGGYALFPPGQLIDTLTRLRRPEGRVYFAGDFASAWSGWMQGAIESGNYVARAIDARS